MQGGHQPFQAARTADARPPALSLRQRADVSVYALTGGFILTCLFAWIMDRRQTAGKETFPKLRDQIADFAVEYIASESWRKNKEVDPLQ